jgi:hypothetical protein
MSAPGRLLPPTLMLRGSVVGTFETLGREVWASVLSKGDAENGVVGGGNRHTTDAEKIEASSR